MLDQTYTHLNLRTIYDSLNRKGVDVAGEYFPKVAHTNRRIRDNREKRREYVKAAKSDHKRTSTWKRVDKIDGILDRLENRKEKQIADALTSLGESISSGNFTVKLIKGSGPGGKPIYKANTCVETLFAIQHIQRNIRSIYKVQQQNRDSILRQLHTVLEDKFPKCVVRTDIKSFYESIPRSQIVQMLQADSLLTRTSMRVIRAILRQYEELSLSKKGLPRGVGISAYLAELYARKIDRNISSHPQIVYYARFVDDIVAVYSLKDDQTENDFKKLVSEGIKEAGLSPNSGKTKAIKLPCKKTKYLTYLGYRCSIDDGSFNIRMSYTRYMRYRRRILLCFEKYNKDSVSHRKQARKDLLIRIRFLTTNTKLKGYKSAGRVGIYFSNTHLNNLRDVELLDRYLSHHIENVKDVKLRDRLLKYNFMDGFVRRKFSRFTLMEFNRIVEAWRYA